MKKYTKTIEVEVSEAVAAGLARVEVMCAGEKYTFTYAQLVELFDLVEEKAVYSWNNTSRFNVD